MDKGYSNVPLFKKTDPSDINNYRVIKICFSKIFTSILNKRISEWIDDNTIVSDAQYGFMAGRSTVDAIFIQNAFVNKALNDKGRLYCGLLTLRKRLTV